MRQGQQNRRGRGRNNNGNNNNNNNNNNNGGNGHNNRRSQSPLSRTYESTGPDVKIRGNASHIAEKYMALARDALSSGDSVKGENYLQHAEHYNRIIMAAQPQSNDPANAGGAQRFRPSQLNFDPNDGSDEGEGDGFGSPHANANGNSGQSNQGQQNSGNYGRDDHNGRSDHRSGERDQRDGQQGRTPRIAANQMNDQQPHVGIGEEQPDVGRGVSGFEGRGDARRQDYRPRSDQRPHDNPGNDGRVGHDSRQPEPRLSENAGERRPRQLNDDAVSSVEGTAPARRERTVSRAPDRAMPGEEGFRARRRGGLRQPAVFAGAEPNGVPPIEGVDRGGHGVNPGNPNPAPNLIANHGDQAPQERDTHAIEHADGTKDLPSIV